MIDAHFHIWRQADMPWLNGPMVPRIFGPYQPLCRDYPIAEYLRDIDGQGITGAVFVQANRAPEEAEAEVAWVEGIANATGWPQAITGFADMTVPDARPALDRLARHPRMRGIRQQLHWHRHPPYRFAARPDLARDPVLQRNIARLADYGWVFELQVFPEQMPAAGGLLDACPDVTFILTHAGMLEDLSEDGRALWRSNIAALARRPNLVAKLSGFGTFLRRNDPAHVGWMISETLLAFGAERCLFGSNFPIEKLWTSYAGLMDAFRRGAGGLAEGERQALFETTARRVYRL